MERTHLRFMRFPRREIKESMGGRLTSRPHARPRSPLFSRVLERRYPADVRARERFRAVSFAVANGDLRPLRPLAHLDAHTPRSQTNGVDLNHHVARVTCVA